MRKIYRFLRATQEWVRARIVYTDDRERVEGFQDEMLSGMSEDWVKRGEYYYFTKIVTIQNQLYSKMKSG